MKEKQGNRPDRKQPDQTHLHLRDGYWTIAFHPYRVLALAGPQTAKKK